MKMVLAAVTAACVLLPVHASATETEGRELYRQKCAMCHGASGMGTMLLGRKIDPALAQLEKRDDLTTDYVIEAARTGIGNMPRILRGDVDDRELKLIADYISRGK